MLGSHGVTVPERLSRPLRAAQHLLGQLRRRPESSFCSWSPSGLPSPVSKPPGCGCALGPSSARWSWCPAEPAVVSRDATPLSKLPPEAWAGGWMHPAATRASGPRVWRGGKGRGRQGTWWKQQVAARWWGAPRARGAGGTVSRGPGHLASWQLQGPSVPLLENGKLAALPF